MEKKKSERHATVTTDMLRLIQAPHSYLNLKQFSIQQSCSGVLVSHCVFDEDIPRSRSLATSHTQEAFHSLVTTMMYWESYLKVLMKLAKGGIKQGERSPIKSGSSLSQQKQCGDNHINESTNNKLHLPG